MMQTYEEHVNRHDILQAIFKLNKNLNHIHALKIYKRTFTQAEKQSLLATNQAKYHMNTLDIKQKEIKKKMKRNNNKRNNDSTNLK